MIHLEAKFLSKCEPVEPDKSCASQVQWWDRHKMDIAISKGETGKKKGVMGSQGSLKSSKANPTRFYGLRIILFSSMSHFLGPRGWQPHSHSSAGQPCPSAWWGATPEALDGGTLAPETEETPYLLKPRRNQPCLLDLGGRSNVMTSESLSGSFFPSLRNGAHSELNSLMVPSYKMQEVWQPSFILSWILGLP